VIHHFIIVAFIDTDLPSSIWHASIFVMPHDSGLVTVVGQGIMAIVAAVVSIILIIKSYQVVSHPYMVFHLLSNIYSWKNKHMWVQHTTLGRLGGGGGSPGRNKKVLPLVLNFGPATPLL
jgi:hypothetical protein